MQDRNVEGSGFDMYEDVECCSVIEGGSALHELWGEGDGIIVFISSHQIDPHILDQHRIDECTIG